MFTNPEFMLALGFAIGIIAGLNIARFCWPDESVWRGKFAEKEKELWNKERELEKREQRLENK